MKRARRRRRRLWRWRRRKVMVKDEEGREEAGEVEKEERVREYQCHQCGRKYA